MSFSDGWLKLKPTILWCKAVSSRSVTFLLWASLRRCRNWLYLQANITPGETIASRGDFLPKNAIFFPLFLNYSFEPFKATRASCNRTLMLHASFFHSLFESLFKITFWYTHITDIVFHWNRKKKSSYNFSLLRYKWTIRKMRKWK